MAKINNFDENKTYVPDIYALLHALANGHFHRKHNTVWSAFNEAQNALILLVNNFFRLFFLISFATITVP